MTWITVELAEESMALSTTFEVNASGLGDSM